MDDLPKTLIEAVRYFADLSVCHEYMKQIKWPDGVITCPSCGATGDRIGEIKTRRMLRCKDCRKQFSATDGTLFEGSNIPLSKWFAAVWAVANMDIDGPLLARAIGVSKRSAWRMLRDIRAAESLILLADDEEWRPIRAYTDAYEASSYGRVRGIARTRRSRSGRVAQVSPRLIQPNKLPSPHDHWVIVLSLDGRRKTHCLHTLILDTFRGPPPPGKQCRHLDGDPDNNHIDNLCWGTPLENAKDRDNHGRTARGSRNASATLTEEQVRDIKSRPTGYGTGKRLAAEFGVSETVISGIRTGKTWQHV